MECPVCAITLAGTAADEVHVNFCLDSQFRAAGAHKPPSPVNCILCNLEITHMSLARREAHVNKCLDFESVTALRNDRKDLKIGCVLSLSEGSSILTGLPQGNPKLAAASDKVSRSFKAGLCKELCTSIKGGTYQREKGFDELSPKPKLRKKKDRDQKDAFLMVYNSSDDEFAGTFKQVHYTYNPDSGFLDAELDLAKKLSKRAVSTSVRMGKGKTRRRELQPASPVLFGFEVTELMVKRFRLLSIRPESFTKRRDILSKSKSRILRHYRNYKSLWKASSSPIEDPLWRLEVMQPYNTTTGIECDLEYLSDKSTDESNETDASYETDNTARYSTSDEVYPISKRAANPNLTPCKYIDLTFTLSDSDSDPASILTPINQNIEMASEESMLAVIKGDSDLYQRLLFYEPVHVDEVLCKFRAAGIVCRRLEVESFLASKGVLHFKDSTRNS
ncbi:hypothetical protein HDU67_001895 [Dinochytrium kinnereticum]|nr:hypothetical protein HDU67_001895 [Dinochytrium kinnereticum]